MPQSLTITIHENGAVNLSGPIDNKLITFGMLELGKEALIRYHQEKGQRVQVAGLEDLQKIAGGGN